MKLNDGTIEFESVDEAIIGVLYAVKEVDDKESISEARRGWDLVYLYSCKVDMKHSEALEFITKMSTLVNDYGVEAVLKAGLDMIPGHLHAPVFANAVEMTLVDRKVVKEEQELLQRLARAFRLPRETAQKIIDVLVIKSRWSPAKAE